MKVVILIAFCILMTACGSVAPPPPPKFEAKIPEEPANESPIIVKPGGGQYVKVRPDRTVHLADKKIGTVDDLAEFEKQIPAGFERLTKEGFEQPRTVIVKAPRAVKYGDVVKVTDKLKEIGAGPIGLMIDEPVE